MPSVEIPPYISIHTGSVIDDTISGAVRGDTLQDKDLIWKSNARQNIDAQQTLSSAAPLDATKGGTGQTSVNASANALINGLDAVSTSNVPGDNDYFISQRIGGNDGQGGSNANKYYRRPMVRLWEYIQGKISTVLGLTASQYGGNAATASSATTAQTATSANTATTAITATYATTASALAAGMIRSSDNLNDYKTWGIFYAGTSAIASSLSNSPVSVPFCLIVLPVGDNSRYQSLVDYNNNHWERVYKATGGGSWSEWTKVR